MRADSIGQVRVARRASLCTNPERIKWGKLSQVKPCCAMNALSDVVLSAKDEENSMLLGTQNTRPTAIEMPEQPVAEDDRVLRRERPRDLRPHGWSLFHSAPHEQAGCQRVMRANPATSLGAARGPRRGCTEKLQAVTEMTHWMTHMLRLRIRTAASSATARTFTDCLPDGEAELRSIVETAARRKRRLRRRESDRKESDHADQPGRIWPDTRHRARRVCRWVQDDD